MPKERTHQYIASQAQNLFIPKARAVYMYGAIAPDIFFFDFFKKPVTSDRLHGKAGEATDEIFKQAIKLWPQLKPSERTILSDFLAGYVVHMITDRVFHPWVIYWSGGVAQEKKYGSTVHHYLETALDMLIANDRAQIKYNKLILKLYKIIAQAENNISRCAWQHKFVTEHLDNNLFLALSRQQPALLTLSYKFCQPYLNQYRLADLSNWLHPVSGATQSQSYQELLTQAIDLSGHILRQVDWLNLPNNDWATLVGPASLLTNMLDTPFAECRYYNTEYFKDFKPVL